MCSLCRLPVAKNHNFGKFLHLVDPVSTPPLLPMRANLSVLEQTHGVRLRAKFCLDRFILSPSSGLKTPIFAIVGFRHLVVSPIGSSLRKLNTVAQPQTFPYPTASKSFLYFNAFMAKSGAQTLTSKSVTNRQTDR